MTTNQLIQTRYTLGILTGTFDYTKDFEGYNPKFDGTTLENGDKCNGLLLWENQEILYTVIDGNCNEYTTNEMPCVRL